MLRKLLVGQRTVEKDHENQYDALIKNGTLELVNLRPGKKPLNSNWMFKTRQKEDETQYKVRLVIKGCAQRRGIDFDETYSLVVRYSSVRYLLALAAEQDLNIDQLDTVTAFLQENLIEEIYMTPSEGFEILDQVCRLKKSLYGLKQASREWNQKLEAKLEIRK